MNSGKVNKKSKKRQRKEISTEPSDSTNDKSNSPNKRHKVNPKPKPAQSNPMKPSNDNCPTVSIALPGSVMSNAATAQLKAYLASQIARAAAIFQIDEIVIFSETGKTIDETENRSDPNLFLTRILQYIETPQYLRRSLFPKHSDFRNVGVCRPLRTPHHLSQYDDSPYREGAVVNRTIDNCEHNSKRVSSVTETNSDKQIVSLVDIGLDALCGIDQKLAVDTRVTVELDRKANSKSDNEYYYGKVVNIDVPKAKSGLYWGYQIRFAKDISAVITESLWSTGYDCIVGTSDKGINVVSDTFKLPSFKHLMIVFGGPKGLENCTMGGKLLEKPELLFDCYINTCPYQGSKTIRTEEAILVTLSVLQKHFLDAGITSPVSAAT